MVRYGDGDGDGGRWCCTARPIHGARVLNHKCKIYVIKMCDCFNEFLVKWHCYTSTVCRRFAVLWEFRKCFYYYYFLGGWIKVGLGIVLNMVMFSMDYCENTFPLAITSYTKKSTLLVGLEEINIKKKIQVNCGS